MVGLDGYAFCGGHASSDKWGRARPLSLLERSRQAEMNLGNCPIKTEQRCRHRSDVGFIHSPSFARDAASVKKGSKPPFAAVGVRVRFGPVAYHCLVGIALSNDGTAFGTTLQR